MRIDSLSFYSVRLHVPFLPITCFGLLELEVQFPALSGLRVVAWLMSKLLTGAVVLMFLHVYLWLYLGMVAS